MRQWKTVGFLMFSLALMVSTSVLAAAPTKAEIDAERKEIRQKSGEILGRLYKLQPSAKATINKETEVFMKMVELQGGLGMGVKKFSLVWIFETPETLATFINSGWELGAQTSMAAKADDKGSAFQGAMAVSPGTWLYQLTESGLALELSAKGTKYYKNDELN
jgi:hypothetical protein